VRNAILQGVCFSSKKSKSLFRCVTSDQSISEVIAAAFYEGYRFYCEKHMQEIPVRLKRMLAFVNTCSFTKYREHSINHYFCHFLISFCEPEQKIIKQSRFGEKFYLLFKFQ